MVLRISWSGAGSKTSNQQFPYNPKWLFLHIDQCGKVACSYYRGKAMEGYTHEEQIGITRGVLSILEGWGVPADMQIHILALPEKTKPRHMKHFREEKPFPATPELMERITHLIAIAEALRTTYPMNPMAGDIWMKKAHRRFNNHSPLRTIVEKGLPGLKEVRGHLDCTYTF